MLRNTFRALVALAVVSGALAVEQAQAFGWRHRGWGGSHGSWGSSGGSWGSSGGSWGSSGGSWGSHGSSGGWYHGSSGSSGGSWGSSGGSWGSHGSSGGSSGGHHHATPPAPAPAPGGSPAPPTPAPPAPSDAAPANSTYYHPTYGPMRNSALLSVKVPADAKVFVNDRATSSTGNDREYISHDLQPGARYNYTVRAEFVRDGKTVTENKSIQLSAGQNADLDFMGESNVLTADNADARTTLIVRLPADAKLFLAGHETKATGEVREFSTKRLPAGAAWATYAIRAVVQRDGRDEVREETVSLKAGDSREVTISFDALASDKVAETASR